MALRAGTALRLTETGVVRSTPTDFRATQLIKKLEPVLSRR
jgi:hypothetical protein